MLRPYHAGKSVSLEIECNLVVVDMLNALIHRPAIVSRCPDAAGWEQLARPIVAATEKCRSWMI